MLFCVAYDKTGVSYVQRRIAANSFLILSHWSRQLGINRPTVWKILTLCLWVWALIPSTWNLGHSTCPITWCLLTRKHTYVLICTGLQGARESMYRPYLLVRLQGFGVWKYRQTRRKDDSDPEVLLCYCMLGAVHSKKGYYSLLRKQCRGSRKSGNVDSFFQTCFCIAFFPEAIATVSPPLTEPLWGSVPFSSPPAGLWDTLSSL